MTNIALTQALIRFKQQELFQGLAVVPYGESLVELSPFLSQLICESLGKGATINNASSVKQHAPILMQGTGPDAQHTFFQQLHQGTPIIPVEFYMTKPEAPNQKHFTNYWPKYHYRSKDQNAHHIFQTSAINHYSIKR